jgi:hypothetical protein
MDSEVERLKEVSQRQYSALGRLNDEIMSILHAHSLREKMIDTEIVRGWLQGLYNEVRIGLGKGAHFKPLDESDGKDR